MPVENARPGATATNATPRKTAARKPASRRTAAGQSASRAAGTSETGASAGRSVKARSAAGKSRLERTTGFSAQVLEQTAVSQQSALEAVRGFMESVDRALAPNGDGPSRRHIVIDSALSMSQQLVKAQYEFLCKVVHGTGKLLGRPDNGK